jgi:phage baseplate assembly protein W
MAIILGKKLVIDTAQFDDYAIGITLPIQIGNTAFNQSFKTIDQARSNIKNVLLTKKYERLMQPNFGSGLQELLFEINDDEFADKVENTIIDAMATWLPYVNVESIDINQSNELKNSNSVEISISFRVGDTPTLETVTFNAQV